MESVEYIRDFKSGRIKLEIRKSDGVLSCIHQAAWIERDLDTGIAIWESWHWMGHQHRTCGPAEIIRDANTGVVLREEWYHAGVLHRTDGPAIIERDSENGRIAKIERWVNGLFQP